MTDKASLVGLGTVEERSMGGAAGDEVFIKGYDQGWDNAVAEALELAHTWPHDMPPNTTTGQCYPNCRRCAIAALAATEETPLVGPSLTVQQIQDALPSSLHWKGPLGGVTTHFNEIEQIALARAIVENLAARREPSDDNLQREYFKRGREWEIAEYKRHLIDHNPQIAGICSWCRMEVEAGRTGPGDRAMAGALPTDEELSRIINSFIDVPCCEPTRFNEFFHALEKHIESRVAAAIERSQTQGAHHGQHSIDCDECRVFRKASVKGDNFPK